MIYEIDKPLFTARIYETLLHTSKYLGRLLIKRNSNVIDLNEYEEFKDIDTIGDGSRIFENKCAKLDKLILPRGVKTINENAFHSAYIRSIVWPEECEEIKMNVFAHSRITEICNISNVKTIGQAAFKNSSIRSITIPEGITTIPDECFRNSMLYSISGGQNIVTIGDGAFDTCQLLSYNIPDKVSQLPRCCFFNCSQLSKITGLEHIRKIGPHAFGHCSKLKAVPSMDKALSISDYAFAHSGVKSIDLGGSLCCSIGEQAFAGSEIESFVPGYYLRDVSPSAFMNTPFAARQ